MSSKSTHPTDDSAHGENPDGKLQPPDRTPTTDSGSSASEPKGDTASSPGHAPSSQDPTDI